MKIFCITHLLAGDIGRVAEIKLCPSCVAALTDTFFGSPKVIKNSITINGTKIVEDDTVATRRLCDADLIGTV